MATLPFMKWFPRDAQSDVAHLTPSAELAYRRILEFMWLRGGYLPLDPPMLASLGRVRTSDWSRVWAQIGGLFSATPDGKITQHRIERDIVAVAERRARLAQYGARGGTAKANKINGAGVAKATKNRSQTLAYQSQSQSQIEEETLLQTPRLIEPLSEARASDARVVTKAKSKSPPPFTAYSPAFEAFWTQFPTDPNMSKKKAWLAFDALGDADRLAASAAVAAFVEYCKKNTTYRPVHAERWLRDRRFDGFIAAKKNGSSNGAVVVEDEQRWKIRLDYARGSSVWDKKAWGPVPGHEGCRVPPELLRDGDGKEWVAR